MMVSRGTWMAKLDSYRALVLKWNNRVPLVSRKTPEHTLKRLINQSLEAAALLPDGMASIVDIGSGAGLPGIPLAIRKPDVQVMLVERNEKKILFLKTAVRELMLDNVRIVASEFNTDLLTDDKPITVTSLGVGSYAELTKSLWPFLSGGDGVLLFIAKSLAEDIMRTVSCGTLRWERLTGYRRTGVAWLEKD